MSADARRLAANALNEDRPALALLQAVEATQREQSPETYGALLTLLTRSPDIVTRFRIDDRFLRIRASADGARSTCPTTPTALRARRGLRRAAVDREEPRGSCPVGHGGRRPSGPLACGAAARRPGVDGHGRPRRPNRRGDAEVMVEDLAERRAGDVPLGGRVGPPVRPERRADDRDARLPDRPRHRRGAAGACRSAPTRRSAGACGTAGSRLRCTARPQTRVLDPAHGTPTGPAGVDRGVDDTGTGSSRPGPRRTARSRRTSSSVTRGGDRSARSSGWTAMWRRWSSSPAGARSPSRGTRSWTSTMPGRWLLADPGGTQRRGARHPAGRAGSGLLWTAGRDGTAVAFDLTGTRGVLRTLDLDVAADAGAAAGDRAVLTQITRPTSTPRASSISRRGATSSASSSRSPTACARSGTPPSPRTAGSPWPGCSSGPTTSPRRSPTGARRRVGHRHRRADAHHRHPLGAQGLAVTPDGERLLVNGSGGLGLYDLASGEELWSHETDLPGGWIARPAACGCGSRRLPSGRAPERDGDPPGPGFRGRLASEELPGPGSLTRVAFSADSRTMALGSDSGRLYFLDVATLEQVAPDRLVTAGFVIDLQ